MEKPAELTSELMSVADVSALLQVSQAQVHNLCRYGELEKIPVPAGRKHHPPRAGVITRDSVERLFADRGMHAEDPAAAPPSAPGRPSPDRVMAHELKVALDLARSELRAQRAQTKAVLTLLKGAVETIDKGLSSQTVGDGITDAYATALTHLLTEDDPASLAETDDGPATQPLQWRWGGDAGR